MIWQNKVKKPMVYHRSLPNPVFFFHGRDRRAEILERQGWRIGEEIVQAGGHRSTHFARPRRSRAPCAGGLCFGGRLFSALRRWPPFRVLSPNSCMTEKVFARAAKRLDEEYSAPEYDENGSGEDMDSTTLAKQTFLRSVLVS